MSLTFWITRHATGVCKDSTIPSGTFRYQSRFGTRFAARKENSLISFSSLSIFVSVVFVNVYFPFCCHSSERFEVKCRAQKGKQFSLDGNYATKTCVKLVCLIKENHWLHGKALPRNVLRACRQSILRSFLYVTM